MTMGTVMVKGKINNHSNFKEFYNVPILGTKHEINRFLRYYLNLRIARFYFDINNRDRSITGEIRVKLFINITNISILRDERSVYIFKYSRPIRNLRFFVLLFCLQSLLLFSIPTSPLSVFQSSFQLVRREIIRLRTVHR